MPSVQREGVGQVLLLSRHAAKSKSIQGHQHLETRIIVIQIVYKFQIKVLLLRPSTRKIIPTQYFLFTLVGAHIRQTVNKGRLLEKSAVQAS